MKTDIDRHVIERGHYMSLYLTLIADIACYDRATMTYMNDAGNMHVTRSAVSWYTTVR